MLVAILNQEVKSGQCVENIAYMKEMIQKAKEDKADLICFPQNAISGYMLGDKWMDEDWCRYVDHFNQEIIALSDDIAIVWGNIKYRGGQLFNAAYFAYQGNVHMRVKTPMSGSYYQDEAFQSSNINSVIDFQDQICALNFGKELQLADWNINIDAHPYDVHETMHYKGNVIYVNAVGMQNCGKGVVVMRGGSYVCKESKLLYHAVPAESGYVLVDTDSHQEVEEKPANLLAMLSLGIKGFDEQVLGGKLPWIVGLSGGLDSSVSAALLTYALGKGRVLGFGMSTRYNSDKTKQNAKHVAEALQIPFQDGSIEPLVDATAQVLHAYGYEQVEGLVQENIQARLRGHLLSSFAAIHGGVIVNNGNKVENALGYCTLYGDAIGALGILGDLTKVQLFSLSKELNEKLGCEAIPQSLLPRRSNGEILWDVAPAAELKDAQVDPMKWYYHDYLVDHIGRDLSVRAFLKSYLDGSIWKSELADIMRFYKLDDPSVFVADLQWFLRTASRNAFKHIQVPCMLSVSAHSYAFAKEVQGSFDDGNKDLWQQIQAM